jgi:hypothetical protein
LTNLAQGCEALCGMRSVLSSVMAAPLICFPSAHKRIPGLDLGVAARCWVAALSLGAGLSGAAQDTAVVHNMGMFFPSPMENDRWNLSLGFVTYTTPEDLTEEVRVRVPAGDLHILRRLPHGFYLDARLLFQVVQNHLSLGARWATPLNDKFTFSLGDDVAYWRGNLPIQGFDCKASGWMNYPSLSLGYRSRRDLLFTAKAEMLITTNYSFIIEGNAREHDTDLVSGSAFSLFIEQPFFKKTYVTLGFTLAYTDFLWTTWSLFDSFDRNLLFPQITTALIL